MYCNSFQISTEKNMDPVSSPEKKMSSLSVASLPRLFRRSVTSQRKQPLLETVGMGNERAVVYGNASAKLE
ncbi:unnamed protein product [Urochloa humidicola]